MPQSLAALFDDAPTVTPTRRVIRQEPAPAVVETVTVRPLSSARRTHLTSAPESWTASQLQDFVVTAIQDRFGPFPREAAKEATIFKSFLARWSEPIEYEGAVVPEAVAIAKHAFGPLVGGVWRSGKISVSRFCKGSDPFFAQPIVERLRDAAK